jgi:histidinol-phosphatase (PHP family)
LSSSPLVDYGVKSRALSHQKKWIQEEFQSRYDQYGDYPFNKTKDLITKILKMVIADGKGIEINTSSFRYGLTDLIPSRDIILLYKKLGGKIITIGSDSHKQEHLDQRIMEEPPQC